MTEDEIRAKRCCGPVGCGELQGVHRMCIASLCAGWAESKPGTPARTDENNNPIPRVPAEGDCGLKWGAR